MVGLKITAACVVLLFATLNLLVCIFSTIYMGHLTDKSMMGIAGSLMLLALGQSHYQEINND